MSWKQEKKPDDATKNAGGGTIGRGRRGGGGMVLQKPEAMHRWRLADATAAVIRVQWTDWKALQPMR